LKFFSSFVAHAFLKMVLLSMELEKKSELSERILDEASTKSSRVLVFYRNFVRNVFAVLSTETSKNDS